LSVFAPFVLFSTYLPLWFYRPLALKNCPQGGDTAQFENHCSKISFNKKTEKDNKNVFTNQHIEQLQALAMQQAA